MSKTDDQKTKIKDDAKGAMAPSQADPGNNGVHSAHPDGGGDVTRKRDDHSSPSTPKTGSVPKPLP